MNVPALGGLGADRGDLVTRALGGNAFAADDWRRYQHNIDEYNRQKQERLDPIYQGIERDLSRGAPGPPKLEEVGEPPNPLPDFQKAALAWAPAAVLFSALAAGISRGHAAGALTGFGNAMQGFTEGGAQMMKEQREHWKDQMTKALQNNRVKLDRYHAILSATNTNMNQKLALLQVETARFNDVISQEQLKQGDLVGFAKMADQTEKQHLQTENASRKLENEWLRMQAYLSESARKTTADQETARHHRATEEISADKAGAKTEAAAFKREAFVNDVDEATRMIDQQISGGGPSVSGLGGEIDRWKNWGRGLVGANVDPTSTKFQSKVLLLEAELPRILSLTSRVSKDERDKVTKAFGALSRFTAPEQAKAALQEIKQFVQRHAGELKETSSSIEPGHEEGGFIFQGGDPGDQRNWRPK